MQKTKKTIKQYIKKNPDVDFDKYLAKEIKAPENKKRYLEEKMKLEIALEIYRLRESQKLTQAQLAKRAKMPQANIARIEKGEHLLTISTLVKILSALNQTVNIKIGHKNILSL